MAQADLPYLREPARPPTARAAALVLRGLQGVVRRRTEEAVNRKAGFTPGFFIALDACFLWASRRNTISYEEVEVKCEKRAKNECPTSD